MLHMALDDYQTCTSKNNSRIRLIRSPVGDDSVRLDISRTISGITLQTTILMFRVIQLCYIINDLHVFLCIADGTRWHRFLLTVCSNGFQSIWICECLQILRRLELDIWNNWLPRWSHWCRSLIFELIFAKNDKKTCMNNTYSSRINTIAIVYRLATQIIISPPSSHEMLEDKKRIFLLILWILNNCEIYDANRCETSHIIYWFFSIFVCWPPHAEIMWGKPVRTSF